MKGHVMMYFIEETCTGTIIITPPTGTNIHTHPRTYGKTQVSFLPKNFNCASVTNSEYVTVISCLPPYMVTSSDPGMCPWMAEAYL
jgi:hypothetical protein